MVLLSIFYLISEIPAKIKKTFKKNRKKITSITKLLTSGGCRSGRKMEHIQDEYAPF